ncbi:MAG TPA: hypothetical protein VGQ42_06380 [Candidatus Dormibacteraeota bacterium]|jgi:hypothetical protein|nr:hypothetical protein [Candidatus Dormibacteraeota bacterium]
MPFWKRGDRPGDVVDDSPRAQHAPIVGSLQCSERDCPNHTGEQCHYVDRRGRQCTTAWCPDHQSIVGGAVYCRRHAGVVGALAGAERLVMPDLENRAPSLVNWVARDVEQVIQDIVTGYRSVLGTDRLVSDPVNLVFLGPERARVWERSWKLVDHHGWSLRVALEVDELRDTQVAVRVGRNVVARMVPPWIEARQRGMQLAPEVDAAQRAEFYRGLTAAVASAIEQEISARD